MLIVSNVIPYFTRQPVLQGTGVFSDAGYQKNSRSHFLNPVDSVCFGYFHNASDAVAQNIKFTNTYFPNINALKEPKKIKDFIKRHSDRIEFALCSVDTLTPNLKKVINKLEDGKPKAVLDMGTSKIKLVLAAKGQPVCIMKVAIPQFKQMDKFRFTPQMEKYLSETLDFMYGYLEGQGIENPTHSEQVYAVATEGLRRYQKNMRDYYLDSGEVLSRVEAFRQQYNLRLISGIAESGLQRKSMLSGVSPEIMKTALTADVGGGSSDCMFPGPISGSHKKRKLISLNIPIGHSLFSAPLNVLELKQLKRDIKDHLAEGLYFSLLGTHHQLKKPTLDESLALGKTLIKTSKVTSLFIGSEPKLMAYIDKKMEGRSIFPWIKGAKPLTLKEINTYLLSAEALKYYQAQQSSYYQKLPVQLAIVSTLMKELGIKQLWGGSSGGLKFALLERFLTQGPLPLHRTDVELFQDHDDSPEEEGDDWLDTFTGLNNDEGVSRFISGEWTWLRPFNKLGE